MFLWLSMVTTSHHGTLVTAKFCVCVQKCNMIRCSTPRPTVAQTSRDMVFPDYGKCRVEHCLQTPGMLPNTSENTCQPTCVSLISRPSNHFWDLQTFPYNQYFLKYITDRRKYRARLIKHDLFLGSRPAGNWNLFGILDSDSVSLAPVSYTHLTLPTILRV